MAIICSASTSFPPWMGTQSAQNWLLLANLIFVGMYVVLTGKLVRWQRKQWALDNRKQEWRELIGTLTQCIQKISIADAARTTPSGQNLREDAQRAALDAERAIEDRLFITEFAEREHVLEAWQEVAKKAFSAGVTLQQESQQKWAALHSKLVRAAQADLGVAVGGVDMVPSGAVRAK